MFESFSPAIQRIIAALEARGVHTAHSLAEALREPVELDDVAPWIRFDETNYVRSLIARGERWELRVLCWRSHQSTSLHAHGPSACAFRVLHGSAAESVLGDRDRMWAPGDVVEESRHQLVHQVGNAGGDALLTLHAYSPPLPVDAPSARRGREIAIVGGGFSGVALATHLLRGAAPDLRITLIERGPLIGRGIAYGVSSPVFRLNVPASKMSLDPGSPHDFVDFAGTDDRQSFLPRSLYGDYIVERFREALQISRAKLRLVRGEAIAIDSAGVHLSDGRRVQGERVVLATGIAPRMAPSSLEADPRIIDAWDECALAALPDDGRVLVLGAGLTALDVVAYLEAHRYRGKVTMLSRRGLLPRAHVVPRESFSLAPEQVAGAPAQLRGLLRWGRSIVNAAIARGLPWQVAIDSFRPHASTLWRRLSPADRSRFVRSVRPYWDVLRHRAPPDAIARVDAWRATGRLELLSGSLVSCTPGPEDLEVVIRSGATATPLTVQAIVRCIGPALGGLDAMSPLMVSLIDGGLAMPDAAGLGLRTDDEGRVVEPDGRGSSWIFALGAPRRASDWETTAVPDIADHAAKLAALLRRSLE